MSDFHIFTQILPGNSLFSGKIYTTGKLFTRRPVVMVVTNFKSAITITITQGRGERLFVHRQRLHYHCNARWDQSHRSFQVSFWILSNLKNLQNLNLLMIYYNLIQLNKNISSQTLPWHRGALEGGGKRGRVSFPWCLWGLRAKQGSCCCVLDFVFLYALFSKSSASVIRLLNCFLVCLVFISLYVKSLS